MKTLMKIEELPFVSIIVPTLNRKVYLRNCLDSLLKLDYPKTKLEIVVVDNGSTDGTTEMVHKEFPQVVVVLEKRRNSCFARNAGWKNAKGQIIAYTDDDCIVDPLWLKTLVSGFYSPDIGGVGGPLILVLRPESVVKKFDGTPVGNFYNGEKSFFINELITANLAVRREVFKTNQFDVSLSHTALEDIDFCRSLTSNGYKLLYLPQAIVYHNMNPKRLTVSYIVKRAFIHGFSLYIFQRKRIKKQVLVRKFSKEVAGCLISFSKKRRLRDVFWLITYSMAFISCLFMISTNK